MKFAFVVSLSATLFSISAHAACSFDRSGYDRVTAGMQVGEVEAVLGCKGSYQGHDESNGTLVEYYVWEVGPAYVSMRFRDGLLTYKVQHGLR